MKNKALIYMAFVVMLAACSGHSAKVLIMASGNIKVNDKTISVEEGTTYQEQTIELGTPATLSVQGAPGSFTVEVPEKGLYILNLKKDTLVGSFQPVGEHVNNRITQEQFQKSIDSLSQLVAGLNVSVANRNFFIPPTKIQKISALTDAKVFGPYHPIPSAFDAGSVPEIYKFYTNNEVREMITKSTGATK